MIWSLASEASKPPPVCGTNLVLFALWSHQQHFQTSKSSNPTNLGLRVLLIPTQNRYLKCSKYCHNRIWFLFKNYSSWSVSHKIFFRNRSGKLGSEIAFVISVRTKFNSAILTSSARACQPGQARHFSSLQFPQNLARLFPNEQLKIVRKTSEFDLELKGIFPKWLVRHCDR